MKKLHVLNITFKSHIKVEPSDKQQQKAVSFCADRNQFCQLLRQVLSLKGSQRIQKLKQILQENSLDQLLAIIKRFQRMQSESIARYKNKQHRRFKQFCLLRKKQSKKKEEGKEDSQMKKELMELLGFMKHEIEQKNKIIMEQESEISLLRQKNKFKMEKFTRKALIEDLGSTCQKQLSKMVIDAKAFMKRDTKSAANPGRKIIFRKDKLHFKKPFTIENKQNLKNQSKNTYLEKHSIVQDFSSKKQSQSDKQKNLACISLSRNSSFAQLG